MATKHVNILERRSMELRARDEALANALKAYTERTKDQTGAALTTPAASGSRLKRVGKVVRLIAKLGGGAEGGEGDKPVVSKIPEVSTRNSVTKGFLAGGEWEGGLEDGAAKHGRPQKRNSKPEEQLISPSFRVKRMTRVPTGKAGSLKESLRDQVQNMSLQAMRRLCETPLEERTPEIVEKICIMLQQLTPLFKDVTQSVLEDVTRAMKVLAFQAYTSVHHQSDVSNQFYIILRGKAEVKIASEHLLKVVNVLGRGEYFGEIGLLKGTKRSATVTARTRLELLTFEKDDFDKLFRPIFDQTRIRRLDFLHSIYSFYKLSPEEMEKLATFFRLRECEDRTVINAEEEDRLYFIVEGECQLKHPQAGELPPVTLDTGNPELDSPSFYCDGKTISRLGPGEFFGEGAMFPRMRRSWLVEAHGATKLFFISRMDLTTHIPHFVWKCLEEEAAFRLEYFDGRLAGKKQSWSTRSSRQSYTLAARHSLLDGAQTTELRSREVNLGESTGTLKVGEKARGDEAALKREEALAALKAGVANKLRELEGRRRARSPDSASLSRTAGSASANSLLHGSGRSYSLSAPTSPGGRKVVSKDGEPSDELRSEHVSWGDIASDASIKGDSPEATGKGMRVDHFGNTRPATRGGLESARVTGSKSEGVIRRHSSVAAILREKVVPLRSESSLVRKLIAEYNR